MYVPASSPAASRIRDKYKNHGRLYDSKKQQTYNTKESKDPQCETTTTAELNQRTQQHLVSEIPSRQTTLLDLKASDKSSLSEGASLKQCLDAISALSIKVDNISSQTSTLKHLACENTETRDSIIEIKESDNIIQMNDATPLLERFYDEDTECGVLRCAPCYELHVAAKPTLRSLTPFRANQLLNPKGNGTLSTGIFFNKETSQHLIRGRHHVWYHHKRRCIDHLCLVGSESSKHHKAMDEYMKKKEELKRETTACRNLFRAAIADLKLGAAAKHLETLLSLLACCSVDIGKMGHGRNNFNDIIYCLEKVVDGKIKSWLSTPLPSTLLPPHYWVTADKATPSRTTNQAVLIVARSKDGKPCPIPVEAPAVYTEFKEASYEVLAKKILNGISDHFGVHAHSQLCGVAADGPYQARGFKEYLRQALGLNDDDDIALPITWDTAHLLNLAVTDVRDGNTKSGSFFRQFIKRCNVFNHVLAHGKGFAFLQMANQNARRPVSYATQRFASSSFEQWVKIEKSFE